jgi:selenocysteine lyase/cysteine desulfurase
MARDLADTQPIVFTTIMEHHANMLPWRVYASKLSFIAVDQDGCLDLEDLERQLRNAPTDHPRIVAIAGAYNVSGYVPPIHTVARLAHRYGAQILVDGAQLVPHRRVSMRGTGPDDAIDFLAFSSHKLYAPYGAGALIAPRDAFSDTPDQLGAHRTSLRWIALSGRAFQNGRKRVAGHCRRRGSGGGGPRLHEIGMTPSPPTKKR